MPEPKESVAPGGFQQVVDLVEGPLCGSAQKAGGDQRREAGFLVAFIQPPGPQRSEDDHRRAEKIFAHQHDDPVRQNPSDDGFRARNRVQVGRLMSAAGAVRPAASSDGPGRIFSRDAFFFVYNSSHSVLRGSMAGRRLGFCFRPVGK